MTAIAAAFCLYAFSSYRRADAGLPPVRTRGTAVSGYAWSARPALDPGRYAGVSIGRIFFDQPLNPDAGIYVSGLVLRGIVRARNRSAVAVLARAGSQPEQESWMVKVGQTVLDEKLVAIGKDHVTLRKGGQEIVLMLGGS